MHFKLSIPEDLCMEQCTEELVAGKKKAKVRTWVEEMRRASGDIGNDCLAGVCQPFKAFTDLRMVVVCVCHESK